MTTAFCRLITPHSQTFHGGFHWGSPWPRSHHRSRPTRLLLAWRASVDSPLRLHLRDVPTHQGSSSQALWPPTTTRHTGSPVESYHDGLHREAPTLSPLRFDLGRLRPPHPRSAFHPHRRNTPRSRPRMVIHRQDFPLPRNSSLHRLRPWLPFRLQVLERTRSTTSVLARHVYRLSPTHRRSHRAHQPDARNVPPRVLLISARRLGRLFALS